MIKILMVCLGNICRSPLAEGILRDKLQTESIDAEVHSAGTGNYHVGDPADPRSAEVARKHNIDLSNHTGRQFSVRDFDRYDVIYAMDKQNYRDILRLARDENDRMKVKMLMNELHEGENIDVPDPYYGGKHGFENVYKMIDLAAGKIIDKLRNKT